MEETPKGTFDKDLREYYQSDADFKKSVQLWNTFPQEEVLMSDVDLAEAQKLLPKVDVETLKTIKTKCSKSCSCDRVQNALDLIKFSLNESVHGEIFLTNIFNEKRPDKKISIMDSVHKADWLPASVAYLDDTKDIPCSKCGEGVHMYVLHDSLAHYWHA